MKVSTLLLLCLIVVASVILVQAQENRSNQGKYVEMYRVTTRHKRKIIISITYNSNGKIECKVTGNSKGGAGALLEVIKKTKRVSDDYIPEEELLTLMKKGRPRGPPRFGKRSSGEPRAYYRLTRPSLTLFRPMTGLLTDNPYL